MVRPGGTPGGPAALPDSKSGKECLAKPGAVTARRASAVYIARRKHVFAAPSAYCAPIEMHEERIQTRKGRDERTGFHTACLAQGGEQDQQTRDEERALDEIVGGERGATWLARYPGSVHASRSAWYRNRYCASFSGRWRVKLTWNQASTQPRWASGRRLSGIATRTVIRQPSATVQATSAGDWHQNEEARAIAPRSWFARYRQPCVASEDVTITPRSIIISVFVYRVRKVGDVSRGPASPMTDRSLSRTGRGRLSDVAARVLLRSLVRGSDWESSSGVAGAADSPSGKLARWGRPFC